MQDTHQNCRTPMCKLQDMHVNLQDTHKNYMGVLQFTSCNLHCNLHAYRLNKVSRLARYWLRVNSTARMTARWLEVAPLMWSKLPPSFSTAQASLGVLSRERPLKPSIQAVLSWCTWSPRPGVSRCARIARRQGFRRSGYPRPVPSCRCSPWPGRD